MAAQTDLWDAIVIGAGVQGCFTAYHLAQNSKKVLLLEQVPCPVPFPLLGRAFQNLPAIGEAKGPDLRNSERCACLQSPHADLDNSKEIPTTQESRSAPPLFILATRSFLCPNG